MSCSIQENVASATALMIKQFPNRRNIKHDSLFNVLNNSLTNLARMGKIEKATNVVMIIRSMLATGIIEVDPVINGVYHIGKSVKFEDMEDENDDDNDEEDDDDDDDDDEDGEDAPSMGDHLSDISSEVIFLHDSLKETNNKLDRLIELAVANNSLMTEQNALLRKKCHK